MGNTPELHAAMFRQNKIRCNDAMRVLDITAVVERQLVVRWVVGSIHHSGPIELFLVPQLV